MVKPNKKNSSISFKSLRDKKGRDYAEQYVFQMDQNKFMSFKEMNEIYKDIAKQYDTRNIVIRIGGPSTFFGTNSNWLSIKKSGIDLESLEMDDDEYFNRFQKTDRNTFDKFTSFEITIQNSKINK